MNFRKLFYNAFVIVFILNLPLRSLIDIYSYIIKCRSLPRKLNSQIISLSKRSILRLIIYFLLLFMNLV